MIYEEMIGTLRRLIPEGDIKKTAEAAGLSHTSITCWLSDKYPKRGPSLGNFITVLDVLGYEMTIRKKAEDK